MVTAGGISNLVFKFDVVVFSLQHPVKFFQRVDIPFRPYRWDKAADTLSFHDRSCGQLSCKQAKHKNPS